ncbi:hypothetical protein GCM10020219_103590 [Nonomuraea dietziae]
MKVLDRINRTSTTVVMATHDAAIVDSMRMSWLYVCPTPANVGALAEGSQAIQAEHRLAALNLDACGVCLCPWRHAPGWAPPPGVLTGKEKSTTDVQPSAAADVCSPVSGVMEGNFGIGRGRALQQRLMLAV